MSDFRKLSDHVWASPQIEIGDIEAAKAEGVTMIVNNRPDGEELLLRKATTLQPPLRQPVSPTPRSPSVIQASASRRSTK